LAPNYCGRGVDVPGITAPAGFCVKRYASVVEARTLVVAPNGDLFVGAPARPTPGGATSGPGQIVLLSDDDHNGVAESHVFLSQASAAANLDDVHGLALGGGFLYFTTQVSVWRVPYADGQRTGGTPQDLGLPGTFGTGGRWTHGLALSKGGQLYASRGAYAQCGTNQGGDISTVGAGGALTTVANGFRNPMYMRCHAQDEMCAAMELGEDLLTGATEKMVVLHPSTNYGFPCCTTMSKPIAGSTDTCDEVTKEDATFPLSDTPFGFDWAPATWPAPYANALLVALHGSAYSGPVWKGASIVYAATNPTTHVPVQDWQTFLGGFGPDGTPLERPADVAFAPDGRLYFADDTAGFVYFIAPVDLPAP
jgi:glucose/arabinose dehydrogenase